MTKAKNWTGKVQVVQSRIFEALMAIPGDTWGALKELTDNPIDAQATEIFVTRDEDRLTIMDNGHGMVPHMSDEDYALLGYFKEELHAGKEPGEVNSILQGTLYHSFVWAMECIGLSAKSLPKRGLEGVVVKRQLQGMRGIGALSFNLIGGTQVWYSRPHGKLAELYYSPDVIKRGVPIMVLHPPTREMIHENKMDYRIEACEERYFRSPVDGSFLPGGTRIEITDLRDEVKNILHRDEIAARLKGLYGEIIRNGDLEIWVIDNTEPGSKPVKVEPASYKGVSVLKGTFEVRLNSRTRYPFVVEIFYDSRASKSYPDLLRAGVKVNKITSVPELKKSELWSLGTLTGKISFPALPPHMDAEAWDALKRSLQDGRIRDLWIEVIRTRVEPQVARKLEEIQSKVHNDALAEAFKSVSGVVQEVLAETPDLARLTFEQPEPPKKKREKGGGGRTIPTSARASVIDENNMAVPGVLVELYRDGALFTKQLTGLSGTVSFGRPGVGEYRFRVILPQDSGFYSDRPLVHDFALKRKLEGHRMVFQIVTGRKPPKQLKDTGFSLSMVTLDSAYFYTIDRLEYGSLGINVEGEHLSAALEAGDDLRRDLLLAEFIAAGLTEFSFADYPLETQHLIRTRLFANLTARLISTKRRRR